MSDQISEAIEHARTNNAYGYWRMLSAAYAEAQRLGCGVTVEKEGGFIWSCDPDEDVPPGEIRYVSRDT